MHFANIVNSYRWIWLSLASEILMRYVDLLRFSSCAICACFISMLQKKSMFGVVAHLFVECSGKSRFLPLWSCFVSGFQCVISRTHSQCIQFSSVRIHTAKANELCKYSGMTKLSGKPHLLRAMCARVCFFSCSVFFLPFAKALWMTVYKVGTHSTRTYTEKQKQFYI